MEKFFMLLIVVPIICFAGNLIIDFNDTTPSSEINFLDLDYLEIIPSGFVSVPAGRFEMGQTGVEEPVHFVNMTRKYFIAKNEVTQKEWFDITGEHPSINYGVGDNYPVYRVNWYSILRYCNLRSMVEGLNPCYTINGTTNPALWGGVPTNLPEGVVNSAWDEVICDFDAKGYRMPTEAEWEYAARYNDGRTYPWGEAPYSDSLCNYSGTTTIVGSYPSGSSKLGINDMSGNVKECVWDVTGGYTSAEETDPTGAEYVLGSERVIRNGGCNADMLHYDFMKSAVRSSLNPSYTSDMFLPHDVFGFRLARTK